MAPLARLPFTYNAQRALYDMTHKRQPNYWDLAVSPDLKIIHYSGDPKPWEDSKLPATDTSTSTSTSKQRTGDYLTDLWRQWHQRSKNFVARYHKEKEREQVWKESHEVRQKQQQRQQQQQNARNPKEIHRLVTKRFKELRQEGHDAKQAMAMARAEQGLENEEPAEVGAKVASMFGVMM